MQLAGPLCKRYAVTLYKIGLQRLVGLRFQDLFHSPRRGAFHLSLTVLFAIGHWGVFSLARWSSQIPSGLHVSRGTWDPSRASSAFAYRAITLYRQPSHTVQLASKVPRRRPATPSALANRRFRLFPLRSPLLRKSIFLSSPPGTEMFQFPRFASFRLCIQRRITVD